MYLVAGKRTKISRSLEDARVTTLFERRLDMRRLRLMRLPRRPVCVHCHDARNQSVEDNGVSARDAGGVPGRAAGLVG